MSQPPTVLDPPPATAPKPRRVKRPIRRTPGTVLGFLALGAAAVVLVLGASIALYIFQDAYKAGHQSSPTEAADAYLDATLGKRSMDFATTYMCHNSAVIRETQALIHSIKQFESANSGSSVKYLWDDFRQVTKSEGTARLTTQVTASTTVNDAVINNPPELWTFDMRDQGGWKVCGLTRSGS